MRSGFSVLTSFWGRILLAVLGCVFSFDAVAQTSSQGTASPYLRLVRTIAGDNGYSQSQQSSKANKESKRDPKSTSDIGAETPAYVLVFSPSYEGRIKWKFGEYEQMVRSERTSFIKEINKFARQGYKAVSSLPGTPIAIVRPDEAEYEYSWFETTSPTHFVKSGLAAKLEDGKSERFRVVEHSLIGHSCEHLYQEDPAFGEKCAYKDLFLIEKELNSKRHFEQMVIGSSPGWGAKPSIEMASEVDEKLADGFYPVSAISQFEILLERVKGEDDILKDKPDVQIVRSGWGTNNVQKRVNEFAKLGYRLAMTNHGIAVMYRNNETRSIPVSYVWMRADKRNFDKELAKLKAKGAVYQTTYPNEEGIRNTLIFEQNLDGKGKNAEFRILSFEFDRNEKETEGRVFIDLTPSSKEAVKKMNEWAKEGFVVRDLFDSGKVSVIMERIR